MAAIQVVAQLCHSHQCTDSSWWRLLLQSLLLQTQQAHSFLGTMLAIVASLAANSVWLWLSWQDKTARWLCLVLQPPTAYSYAVGGCSACAQSAYGVPFHI